MLEPLAGIVLAGGASRRLGRDKALIAMPDGRPLLRTVVDKLAAVCQEVLIVADRAERYQGLALPARLSGDRIPGQGPLGGLHTGLQDMAAHYALVVAADMPFLNPALLRYMADCDRHYQALVPIVDGQWQTLHAIYARTCLPVIEALLAQGSQPLTDLLARVQVRPLPREEWQGLDPQGLSFFNLNRPQDLRIVRLRWRQLTAGTSAKSA